MSETPLVEVEIRPGWRLVRLARPDKLNAFTEAMHRDLAAALDGGAKRLLAKPWDSPDALTKWLYALAVSRPPLPPELEAARELLGAQIEAQGVQDLLWAICMLPEFQIIR